MTNLTEIERKMNIVMPNSYKQFYSRGEFNNFRNINIHTDDGEKFIMVEFMEGDEIISAFSDNYDFWGYDFLPIGVMEYGDFMCLDFRNDSYNPQVVYWNYELALEGSEDSITVLFSNFDQLYGFLTV